VSDTVAASRAVCQELCSSVIVARATTANGMFWNMPIASATVPSIDEVERNAVTSNSKSACLLAQHASELFPVGVQYHTDAV
jgi:hypothetical protein